MTVVFCTVIGAQQYSEMHGTFSTNSCIAEFADEFVDESVRKSTKSTNSTCASCAWCRLSELSVTSRLPQTSCFSQGSECREASDRAPVPRFVPVAYGDHCRHIEGLAW